MPDPLEQVGRWAAELDSAIDAAYATSPALVAVARCWRPPEGVPLVAGPDDVYVAILPTEIARLWHESSHQDAMGASMDFGDDPVVEARDLPPADVAALSGAERLPLLVTTAHIWDAEAVANRTWGRSGSTEPTPTSDPLDALHAAAAHLAGASSNPG
jgi:hypothetical protein